MSASASASSVPSSISNLSGFVLPGDHLNVDSSSLTGHGTRLDDSGRLVATVAGFVERVNKLVSVRPLNCRYVGEIGEVVVGRIIEVGEKRWKVDVGARQFAILQLSAVNLPGGVQRRRTAEDSLTMRELFSEGDFIAAEVQKVNSQGGLSLHTRNSKYQKLTGGIPLKVPQSLIKRCKYHFQALECGVDVILGNNGFIWVEPGKTSEPTLEEAIKAIKNEEMKNNRKEITKDENSASVEEIRTLNKLGFDMREKLARVRNSILALAAMKLPIYNVTIMDVFNSSMEIGIEAKSILEPEFIAPVTQTALARRSQQISVNVNMNIANNN